MAWRGRIRFLWLAALVACAATCPAAAETTQVCSEAVPVHVKLNADYVPTVGQEGSVTATVSVDYDLPNVTVEIELPTEGKVLDQPRLALSRMQVGAAVAHTRRVKFSTPGNKFVRAVVRAEARPGVVWSAVDYLALNIGTSRSQLGFDQSAVDSVGELVEPGDGAPVERSGVQSMSVAGAAAQPALIALGPGVPQHSESEPPPPGSLVITGTWRFYDRADVQTGQRQNIIELRRGDDGSNLAWAFTNWDGTFTFPAVTNPGAAGVYVSVSTWTNYGDGNYLSVITPGGDEWSNRFVLNTGTYSYADGTHSIGSWSVPNGHTNERAWWIKDDMVKAMVVPPDLSGRHVAEWSSTSTIGTYYSHGGNIHLKAGDADDTPDTVLHEMGHSVMYNIYGNYMPPSGCPSPHYLMGASAPGCGWTEGWAHIWHMWTTNDPIRSYPGGGAVNLETATWGDGYDQGDQVEGRVAGAVWDITDSTNDGNDIYDGDWDDVWDVMWNVNCDTFADFWAQWKARGHAKHGPVASIYQSTIDYDTAPTLSGIPDVSRNENTTNNNVLDLWNYASDAESSDSQLTYTITGNTNTNCGASIDSSGYLDINPTPHWYGTSTVTIRCSDGPKWDSDSLVITIVRVDDPPSISGLPDRIVPKDAHYNNNIDLWSYASDPYDADSALTFAITGNTSPNCGATVSSNRYISFNPTAGWTGMSNVTVRVTDPDGFWDEDTLIVVVGDQVLSCADARNRADGSWVFTQYLTTVTAQFPGNIFYIEDYNRVSGIRVSGTAPPVGNYVWVAGQLASYFGERVINAQLAMDYGADPIPPTPLFFRNNVLGGGSPNTYTRQVPEPDGLGCYNVGLLAKTTGTVVQTGGNFWIDDGSHAVYTPSLSALYVDWSPAGTPPPPLGARVAVTGISGATTFSGNTIPKFRPRYASDLMGLGGRVAYLYDTDLTTATAFSNMLLPYHWTTSRYSIGRLPSSFANFDVIIIGGDTGDWSNAVNVARVLESGRPVVAIGSGGGRFLDKVHSPELNIGWLPSAVGSANTGYAQDSGMGLWHFDRPITIPTSSPLTIQSSGGNVEVYSPPASVTKIVRDPVDAAYWPIAQEDRFMQWGFYGGPSVMTTAAKDLFVNCLYYMQGK